MSSLEIVIRVGVEGGDEKRWNPPTGGCDKGSYKPKPKSVAKFEPESELRFEPESDFESESESEYHSDSDSSRIALSTTYLSQHLVLAFGEKPASFRISPPPPQTV